MINFCLCVRKLNGRRNYESFLVKRERKTAAASVRRITRCLIRSLQNFRFVYNLQIDGSIIIRILKLKTCKIDNILLIHRDVAKPNSWGGGVENEKFAN